MEDKQREKLLLERNNLVIQIEDLEGQLEISDEFEVIEDLCLTKSQCEERLVEIDKELERDNNAENKN